VVRDGESIRLDQFLVRCWPGVSRRLARLAIGAGAVLVNGRRGLKGQMLRPGDVLRADRAPLHGAPTAQPELAVAVLYADAAVVAVDKPAGMPAIALRPDDRDTLANYLLGRYPELAAIGGTAFEAGLAHRLDTPTSGVLVAGRTDAAWRRLRALFRDRRVDKLYLAAVAGQVRRGGVVTAPIAHRPGRPREMSACPDPDRAHMLRARPAVTRYRPLRHLTGATLLAVSIPTGVRHQIRVHLASIGHPVLGDPLYGDAVTAGAARLLLHAARLAFAHPIDGRRVVIRSSLPADFQAALQQWA
jgi:23S rRNA pseudouridine1911/1915/1917 synthase